MDYRAPCELYRHKAAIRPAHRPSWLSGEPAEVGWNPGRLRRGRSWRTAWATPAMSP